MARNFQLFLFYAVILDISILKLLLKRYEFHTSSFLANPHYPGVKRARGIFLNLFVLTYIR